MTKTDKFVVPEPSEEAVRGAHGVWFGERAIYAATEANFGYWREAAQKLYAVDVPRIVRAEVERALEAIFGKDGLKDCSVQRYVRERFGAECNHGGLLSPNPLCSVCTREPAGIAEMAPLDARNDDRLAKLEAFCTALAKERVVGAEGPQGLVYDPLWATRRARADDEATAAARAFLAP